jgi:hypothetical protein
MCPQSRALLLPPQGLGDRRSRPEPTLLPLFSAAADNRQRRAGAVAAGAKHSAVVARCRMKRWRPNQLHHGIGESESGGPAAAGSGVRHSSIVTRLCAHLQRRTGLPTQLAVWAREDGCCGGRDDVDCWDRRSWQRRARAVFAVTVPGLVAAMSHCPSSNRTGSPGAAAVCGPNLTPISKATPA